MQYGLSNLQYAWSNSNTEEPIEWTDFTNGSEISKTDCIEGSYYLAIDINDMAPKDIANIDAQVSEYLAKSAMTIHYLEEYGKLIMEDNCFDTIVSHFA